MKTLKLTLVFSAFALFIFACSADTPTNTTATTTANANRPPVNYYPTPANTTTAPADDLAEGRKIYNQTCANCHKEDGTGGKKVIEGKTINADNLTTDKMKQMADAKYVDYVKNGVPDEGMPAFKDRLNDQQISAVIKFIRTEFQKQ